MKPYIIFLALALAAPTAQAELFRWVDADGAVTYQDQPPPEEVTGASMVKLPALGRSRKNQKPPVTLYRTADCAPCDYAARFLKRRNVDVNEIDVSSDLDKQKELKEKAGSLSVPTIVLAGKVIKGFTPSWLTSELDAAGYTSSGKKDSALQSDDPLVDENEPVPAPGSGGYSDSPQQ